MDIKLIVERVDRAKRLAASPQSGSRAPELHFEYVNELAAAYPHIRRELDRCWAAEIEMREELACLVA